MSISSNAVNITTPGTASSYVWFSAPGQSQYFVPTTWSATRSAPPSRLPLCAQLHGHGSARQHALLWLVPRIDDIQHLKQRFVRQCPNTSVPGVVLAVSPNDKQVLINDPVRRVFYIYNSSGSVTATFTGIGSSAAWTPDSQTLYVSDSASLGAGHSDTLYVYNANTGWTTYDLTSSGGATNLAITVPGVGAYLSGNPTVAHTWCPSGTASNYSSLVFYPQGDSVPVKTDTLAATNDGQHMLGAAIVGGGAQLSDIDVSIPFNQSTDGKVNMPKACPQSGQTLGTADD